MECLNSLMRLTLAAGSRDCLRIVSRKTPKLSQIHVEPSDFLAHKRLSKRVKKHITKPESIHRKHMSCVWSEVIEQMECDIDVVVV